MNFATRLRALRENKNLSQTELSDRLNLSKSSISMYEQGKRNPDFETLEIFADYFNVDMNYLLGKDTRSTYYLDPEVAELAQELKDNEGMRVLFNASRNMSKEDIDVVVALLNQMKKD